MNQDLSHKKVIIVADGAFPTNAAPLRLLQEADFVVCCDGAAASLTGYGIEPGVIIGDLDSLSTELAERFSDRLLPDPDQETNDLTKAVNWCIGHKATDLTILGATGKREDHTLGNISLLADYGKLKTPSATPATNIVSVKMVTDTGILFPVYGICTIETFPGQPVSIFSLDSTAEVTSTGLKYPLNKVILRSWWTATLNIATGTSFTLTLAPAPLIIYLGHPQP